MRLNILHIILIFISASYMRNKMALQYMYNTVSVNPTYAGNRDNIKFYIIT